MATEKKKMRLVFFWTDEQVYLNDFRKKYSQKMVEWANEFFGRYGFEIEGYPNQKLSRIPLSHKFCLAKENGIIVDLDAVLHEEERAEIRRIYKQQDDLYERLSNESDVGKKNLILGKMLSLHDEIDAIKSNGGMNYEGDLRKQIGIAMPIVAPKLDALPVVFCKIPFKPASLLSMRKKGTRTGGLTYSPASNNIKVSSSGSSVVLDWYNYFIVIDPTIDEPITLAHEMAHATGKLHPSPKRVVDLMKYLEHKPVKVPWGSNLAEVIAVVLKNGSEYESLFTTKHGGYFHGDPNYILNYNAIGLSPSEVVMLASDITNFENTFFVK